MTPVDRQLELRFKPSARTAQAGDLFFAAPRALGRHAPLVDEIRAGRILHRRPLPGSRRDCTTSWFGVRNYQARNYMRDDMQPGGSRFFLPLELSRTGDCRHRRSRAAGPILTSTQFERKEPLLRFRRRRATTPRWFNVDVTFHVKKRRLISLGELRAEKRRWKDMVLLRRGNRLSITPVTGAEWSHIVRMAAKGAQKLARS